MKSAIVKSLLRQANRVLKILHMKLIRTWEEEENFKDFITCADTLAAAKEANLSVGNYIDSAYNTPGATQETVDKLHAIGALSMNIDRVCEIGPGSGRYLQKVMEMCKPSHYEIYETANDWREWLQEHYRVIAHEPDGVSLAQTDSDSIDLVHAHKVFPGLKILTIIRYIQEMTRVCRPSGIIIFDALTKDCFDAETVSAWMNSRAKYPGSMLCRKFAIELLERTGCKFVDGFVVPMLPGKTEILVFRKVAPC